MLNATTTPATDALYKALAICLKAEIVSATLMAPRPQLSAMLDHIIEELGEAVTPDKAGEGFALTYPTEVDAISLAADVAFSSAAVEGHGNDAGAFGVIQVLVDYAKATLFPLTGASMPCAQVYVALSTFLAGVEVGTQALLKEPLALAAIVAQRDALARAGGVR